MGHNHRETSLEIRNRIRNERLRDDMGFSLQWQWELACSDASPSQKLAGMYLRLFGDADGSNNAPALRTLSAVTGLAESTLKIALIGLEDLKFAKKIEGSGRRPNSYDLRVPDRTFDELATAMGLRSEPITGSQVNGSKPTTGSQNELKSRSEPITGSHNGPITGSQSRSEPICERSEPTTGYDLDNLEKNNNRGTRAPTLRPTPTPLPESWLTAEDRAYAQEKGLTVFQVNWLAEDFADYWRSDGAKDGGLKTDWRLTWRRRVRDAIARGILPKPAAYANGSAVSRGRPGR